MAYNKIKRFTAFLVCITLLFSFAPTSTYADVVSSAWVEPTSGMELEKAETYEQSHQSTIILYVGETATLDIPNGYTNSNPGIVTVSDISDSQKTVYAQTAGFSTIYYTGGCVVVRVIAPQLTVDAPQTATPDSTAQLTVTADRKPIDADNPITWSTSNASIATVSEKGVVTFHGEGNVTITASTSITRNNASESLAKSVNIEIKSGLQSLTLSDSAIDLFVGDTQNVTVFCNPEHYLSQDGKVTVRSTNPNVVTVNRNGNTLQLTATGKGSAVVIVSCEEQRALLSVTVDQVSMLVQPENLEIIQGSTYVAASRINPVAAGENVTVTVQNPTVASATWVGQGENVCIINGHASGTTDVCFALTYHEGQEEKTITQTIRVNVVADDDSTKQSYTVSFIDYDGTLLFTKQAREGHSVEIPAVDTVREGYVFSSFQSSDNSDQTEYHSGDLVTVNGNMVLEAQYRADEYTVTFQNTELSAALQQPLPATPQTVMYGELLQNPEYGLVEVKINDPNGTGERYYRFDGWKNADNGTMWDFQQPVTSSVTLEPVWNMVTVEIICRTFKGEYGDPLVVPKGSTNVLVANLPKFTRSSNAEYYSYEYVNRNGVGKVVNFCFWQHGNQQIKFPDGANTVDYTIAGPVLQNEIITAVYEPGAFGPNAIISTYYHSTNVYVPVDFVVKNTGEKIHNQMELTDVYPLYRVMKSPVYGIEYTYNDTTNDYSQYHDKMPQLSSNEADTTYQYNEFTLNYANTAKFGRVDLSYYVGQEFEDQDTHKVYLITGIDQSSVETVWMCDMIGHVFNGYCVGGTWNALGQVTLYLEEKTEDTCKIRVSYYMLPDDWQTNDPLDNAELQTEEATVLSVDQVLNYEDFVDGFGGLYPNVAYVWVEGSQGDLTVENGEYELKLYYADVTYNLTVNYFYRTVDGAGEKASDSVNQTLCTNQTYNVSSPVLDGYVADKPVVQGTIINRDVVVDVYYEKPIPLHYVALKGGSVTRSDESVNEISGTAAGSFAVANVGYVFDGWYYDEACKLPIDGAGAKFVPQKEHTDPNGAKDGKWHEATFYAKFKDVTPIVIKSASGEWAYDGNTYTKPEYTVTYGGIELELVSAENDGYVFELPTGDKLTVTPTTDGVTNVSDSAQKNNTFTYVLENANNYADVSYEFGDLSITPKPVTVTLTGHTETETYDGTEKSVTGYDVEISVPSYTEDDFTYSGSSEAKGTDVGEYPMVLDQTKLTNQNPNYEVTFVTNPGKLTIEPINTEVKIIANSKEKVYDGAALTDGGYTWEGLPEGYTVEAVVKGSQTDKGDSPNTIESYVIKDENGNVVTDNYTNVTTVAGTLTVTPKPVVITVPDASKYYGEKDPVPLPEGKLPADLEEVYQKELENLDLSVKRITEDEDAGSHQNVLTLIKSAEELKNDYPNYEFTVELGDFKIIPKSIVISSDDGKWEYDGATHLKPAYTVLYDGELVFSDEGKTDVFTLPTGDKLTVTPTADGVTNVSDSAQDNNTFTYVLENANNYPDVSYEFGDLSITPKPVIVTLTGHTETETYDGTEKSVTGYDVEISDSSYTEDYFTYSGSSEAKGTDVGEYPMVLDQTKLTNQNPNYAVTFVTNPGKLTIEPINTEVKIIANSKEKVYDGTELTDGGYTWEGLPEGYTVEAVVEGSQTDKGDSPNTIKSYVIKDKNGNEVTDNYTNVTTVAGKLTVTPKPVTVTLTGHTMTETYDGTKKTVTGYEVEISGPGYTEDDFTYSGSSEAIGTNVGEYPMVLDQTKLTNNNPNYEVTFVTNPGKLTIEPINTEVKIIANSKEKVYDGTELTDGGYTWEGLPEGYTVEAVVEGSQTDKGDSFNTIDSYVIKDKNGNEVTDNYTNVTTVAGKLTVTPKPVTVTLTGHTETETYDGTEKSVTGYEVEISDSGYTKYDFTYSGSSEAKGTDVGEYPMELDQTKLTNKNPNYEVTFVTNPGKLTIESVELSVTKTSDKTGKKVAPGEKITYTITVENKGSLIVTNVKVDDEKTGLHEVIPLMLPGAKNEFTTTWIVTEADVLAGKILNSVTAKAAPIANPQDPAKPFIPQGEDDVTDTPVAAIVDLVVVKTSDKEGRRVAKGETITYTIVVKNKGNVTLRHVQVDDEKTGLHTEIASLAPGAMKEFTTIWTVTEAEVNAGKVLNSVTAKADPVKDPKNPKVPIVPQDTDTVEDRTARTTHRVTVNYYMESIGGETAAPQVVQVLYAGDEFCIVSPEIPGYTASIQIVEGTMGSGDLVYNVIYKPTEYKLTIEYVDADGNLVMPPYQGSFKAGENYFAHSPNVNGMICTRPEVNGIMPDHDMKIVVIYLDAAQCIVVNEQPIPMGNGTVNLNAGDCFE